jgi:hypothetical protein
MRICPSMDQNSLVFGHATPHPVDPGGAPRLIKLHLPGDHGKGRREGE